MPATKRSTATPAAIRAKPPEAAKPASKIRRMANSLPKSAGPAYQQIAQIMRLRILSGQLSSGAQLPTEDEIMASFGVSRHTARAAVQILAVDDLIERFPGRGTFVKDRKEQTGHWGVRSLDEMLDRSFKGATKILDITTIEATAAPDAAISLRVDAHDRLFRVRLQRTEGRTALTYAVVDVPVDIAKTLPKDLATRLETQQLLHIIEETTGIHIVKVRQISTACSATSETAKLLGVKTGTALLLLRNVFLDATDRPIETSAILCNPAHYRHVVELDRAR